MEDSEGQPKEAFVQLDEASALEELNLFREEWTRSLKEDRSSTSGQPQIRAEPSAKRDQHRLQSRSHQDGNDGEKVDVCMSAVSAHASEGTRSKTNAERDLIDLLNLPDPSEERPSDCTKSAFSGVPEPLAKRPKSRLLDMLIADWDEINEIPFFDVDIPRELAVKIFRHLDPCSLCRCSQVSQSWRSLANDEVLWFRVARCMGFVTEQSITSQRGWKAFVRRCVLHQQQVEQNWRERKCGVLKLSDSRDGRLTCALLCEPHIAAGYSSGNVHLWNLTGEPQARVLAVPALPDRTVPLAAKGHTVKCVAVGQAVVAASSAAPILAAEEDQLLHQVTVWDASSGLSVFTYSTDCPVRSVAVDYKTSSVAAAFGRSVRVDRCNDVAQWQCIASITCGEADNSLHTFNNVRFMKPYQAGSAESQRLLVSTGFSLSLFVLRPLSNHCRPEQFHVSLSLGADNVGAECGPVHMFERPVAGRNVCVMSFDSTPSHIAVGTTGYGIDALCEGSQVRVHDAVGGGLVASIVTARASCLSIGDAACDEVVTGGFDHKVRVFDIRSASRVLCLSGSSSCVTAVQMDGNKVVSGSANGVVHVWDKRNGLLLWETYASDPVSLCQFTKTQLITANIPSCDVTTDPSEGVDLLFRRRHMGSLMLYDFDVADDDVNVLDICKSTYDVAGASNYNLDLIVPYADDR